MSFWEFIRFLIPCCKEKGNSLQTVPVSSKLDEDELIRVVAIDGYEKQQSDEHTFSKDDHIFIKTSELEEDWVSAFAITSDRRPLGLVPRIRFKLLENEQHYTPGFHNVDRTQATRFLIRSGVREGTYIIRHRIREPNEFATSVRCKNLIKNIKIHAEDGKYYIKGQYRFNNLRALTKFHAAIAIGKHNEVYLLHPQIDTTPPKVHFKQLEISEDTLIMHEKLGNGNFGDVYKGRLKSVLDVAVKTVRPGSDTTAGDSRTNFIREAQTMHELQHENIVEIIGVCTRSETIKIICEFMENGSLYDFLRNSENQIQEQDIFSILKNIVNGMCYLEERRVIHKDLRAANILINKYFIAKVSDFGLATLLTTDNEYTQNEAKFPWRWAAPEALSDKRFTQKSDVWSFGMLMFETITVEKPFHLFSCERTKRFVCNGEKMSSEFIEGKLKIELMCFNDLYEIMSDCWTFVDTDRPTFENLAERISDLYTQVEEFYK